MAHQHGSRMRKFWTRLPAFSLTSNAAGTTLVSTLNFETPSTILRIVGEYVFSPNGLPPAAWRNRLAVGFGVVSSDAAALGSTAMPDPGLELEFPWLWWREHAFAGDDVYTNNPAVAHRQFVDARAMRKMKNREALVIVLQQAVDAGTQSYEIIFASFRVLVGE